MDNTPEGKFQRRNLAVMASYYSDQLSRDVREGTKRRVQSGHFPNRPPYGYKNVRIDGKSRSEVDLETGPTIRRIFELYAYHGHTLVSLSDALANEGRVFRRSMPRFPKSSLYDILTSRAYIGEVLYQGQWSPGIHEPLVDRVTWDRVQVRLGVKAYRSHETTFGSELIRCGYCGRPITGERKTKKTKTGTSEYTYYRCSRYSDVGHPRPRVAESDLDHQVLALFGRMRLDDEETRAWFVEVLQAKARGQQRATRERAVEVERELGRVHVQQDKLLNLHLSEDIDPDAYRRKSAELRDREAKLRAQVEACGRGRGDDHDLAVKAFELSQHLQQLWVGGDYGVKRRALETVCLNFRLDDRSLVPTMRKPFDVLTEGLISKESRGDRI
jgi:hypothetical protein